MGEITHRAPRFEAYLKHLENKPLLLMRRSEWQKVRLDHERMVEISLSESPFATLAIEAQLKASIAERTCNDEVNIKIYRIDENDAPYCINEDIYSVWDSIPEHYDLYSIVCAASTEDNPNLRSFLQEYVFIVRQQPGPNHWLKELPTEVLAVISGG